MASIHEAQRRKMAAASLSNTSQTLPSPASPFALSPIAGDGERERRIFLFGEISVHALLLRGPNELYSALHQYR